MIQTNSAESVAACRAAAERGVAWPWNQQTPAGNWRQPEAEVFDAYYKGGWALAARGQLAAASRLLTHVQRTFLAVDGDFEPRAGHLHTDVARLYSNSDIVLTAWELDRYEIAAPAVRYLLSQQDRDHGGFYSCKTPPGDDAGQTPCRRPCVAWRCWPPDGTRRQCRQANASLGWSRCSRRRSGFSPRSTRTAAWTSPSRPRMLSGAS